jgi:hypothetical protein
MASIQAKSEDERIDIFYSSLVDRDIAFLNIPDRHGVNQVIQISRFDTEDLEETLGKFNELMRKTVGR